MSDNSVIKLTPLKELRLGLLGPYRFGVYGGGIPSASTLAHNLSNCAQRLAKEAGAEVTYGANPFGQLILKKDYAARANQIKWLNQAINTHSAHYDVKANVWNLYKLPACQIEPVCPGCPDCKGIGADQYNGDDYAELWNTKEL